jgi:hypothetical protein
VDLQNEPWAGQYPIKAGADWICVMADFLKNNVGLGKNNILVVSGGISGLNGPVSPPKDEPWVYSRENFPDEVFTCSSVDVIAIHA